MLNRGKTVFSMTTLAEHSQAQQTGYFLSETIVGKINKIVVYNM